MQSSRETAGSSAAATTGCTYLCGSPLGVAGASGSALLPRPELLGVPSYHSLDMLQDGQMSRDKPPLKLLVEPDEYLCTWLLPGTDGDPNGHAGAIDLQPDRPPVGSVHGHLPIRWTETATGGFGAGFPQEVQLPYLQARLVNGYDVALVDVSITYWFAGQGTVRAGSATVGAPSSPRGFTRGPREEDETAGPSEVPTYSRICAQVGALDALAGTPPFSRWTFPKGGEGRHLEGDWTVSGNPESSEEWKDDDVTVRLEYIAGISAGNPYEFRFTVSPVMQIEARDALTIREWVDQWVLPLRRITSIATGAAQPLTYLAVYLPDADDSGAQRHQRQQVYGSGITQEPYQSDQASVRKSSTAVFIGPDGLSLLDMLRRWQGLERDHHPLIETYGAMLSATDEHPRSRYLLLVQALEGLYGHETSAQYVERQERHTEKRQALLATLKNDGTLDAGQRRFLKSNLARRPLRGLDEALRYLLKELPVDLTPGLSACNLLSDYMAEATGPETQRVAYALSQVRNDLAHGNRGFDPYDLNEAVQVLERMVRAHALRLLGCPDSVLKRVCDPDR